jgi:hypothetical protein
VFLNLLVIVFAFLTSFSWRIFLSFHFIFQVFRKERLMVAGFWRWLKFKFEKMEKMVPANSKNAVWIISVIAVVYSNVCNDLFFHIN